MTKLASGLQRRESRREAGIRAAEQDRPGSRRRIEHRAQDISVWRRPKRPPAGDARFDLHPLAPLLKRTHADLVREVIRACNLVPGVFLFPVDVARAKAFKRTLGMTGTPDLLGWKVVTISYGSVALAYPLFVAFECKVGRDRLRPGQRAFLDKLRAVGGLAAEIRSAEEAVRLLKVRR